MANLLQKLIFRSFYLTIADAVIGSLKSLHFDKYLDDMLVKFEPNRMV